MKLEDELKMQHFSDAYQRAYLNILFTGYYLESNMQRFLKPLGLTTHQYNVLRILRGAQPKGASASSIQGRMLHSTSNVTRIIEKLLEKELVTRKASATNRRIIDISITDKGLQLLSDVDEPVKKMYHDLHQQMTEEEAVILGELLDKVRG
jgi:DNA-binding MarR family transcriptional regulator